jgi:hypothetical protein
MADIEGLRYWSHGCSLSCSMQKDECVKSGVVQWVLKALACLHLRLGWFSDFLIAHFFGIPLCTA